MLLTLILLKPSLKIGVQSAGLTEFFTAHDFQRENLTGISGKSSFRCWTLLKDGDIIHFVRLSFDLCWITPKPHQAGFVPTLSWGEEFCPG